MLTSVTRFPGGVNAQRPDGAHADLRVPFIGNYAQFFDDFMPYTAGNYVVTGTGSVAQAAAAAKANENGIALVTTPAGGGEQALQSQSTTLPFAFAANKEMFVGARMAIDDATLGGFLIGLTGAATAPIGTPATDGVYLVKNSNGQPSLFVRSAGSVVASVVAPQSVTLVNGAVYDLAVTFSPVDGILRGFIFSPSAVGTALSMPLPAGMTFPIVGLSPNFSVIGTAAGARVCQLDYLWAAKSR